MGVGVLIGHNGKTASNQIASTPPIHVTVGGGSSPTAATGTGKKSKAKTKASKSKTTSKSKSVSPAKASAAASKVLGTTATNLPPATVKVGQPGHGKGYQNGKFTGGFFGGG